MLRAFFRAPSGVLGLFVAACLLVVAVVSPPLFADIAIRPDPAFANLGPSSEHLLGTDQLGRDIWIRMLVATRLTLGLALAAAAFGASVGVVVGAFATTLPPRIRSVALRAIDAVIAFPLILVAIFVGAIVGAGGFGAFLGVGIALSFNYARVASALGMSIGGQEYIASARVLGIRGPRLVLRYILPNMAETLAITSTVSISAAIVSIASLSFLGLGVQAPQFDWGSMLTIGVLALYAAPAAAIGPMVAIAVAALAFGFVGEAFARALNPVLWARIGGRRATMLAAAGAVPGQGLEALAQIASLRTETDAVGEAAERSAPATDAEGDRSGADGVLEVRNVSVFYPAAGGELPIIEDVSFSLREGEMIGLVGESGSGKTMTAMAIAQLTPYPCRAVGTVTLQGKELRRLSASELDRFLGTELAVVFQDPMTSFNPALRIGRQMTERPEVHQRLRHDQALALAARALADVHIPAAERVLSQHPHELSGGMRQRVMIAMGLMTRPALLVADEPTTALDVTIQAQIMDLLDQAHRATGAAVILVSHNLGLVSQNCSRVMVMYAGRIVEELTVTQLLSAPRHPYTRALLDAVPEMTRPRESPLNSIPGQAPDPDSVPSGCPYHPRCPLAVAICRSVRPPLRARGEGNRVACHVANQDLGDA